MTMTKAARIGLMVALVALLGIAYALLAMQPKEVEGMARVHMLDVGQGDSILIEAPNGSQLLIDGGKDATVLSELSKVMKWNDKHIDVVIATHPDADHVGGLVEVLRRYDVDLFLTSDVYATTDIYKSVLRAVAEKKIPAYFVRAGMKIGLDAAHKESFTILFPDRDTHGWETNTASVVGRLQIGERSALFTGDSPLSIEEYLAKKIPRQIDVDILKLGHHGSKTSSSLAYLKTSTPILALISAGKNNSYGHPHPEVISRLKSLNIPYISTQSVGTVTLETDGGKWYRLPAAQAEK